MKNRTIEKYFSQKSLSLLDLICIIVAAVGAVVGAVVWGGGPIGFGLLGVSLAALAFSRSARAKDDDVDKELSRLLSENGLNSDAKDSVSGFDLESGVIKGKDQKLRSVRYFITSFDFLKDKTAVREVSIDLINGTVSKTEYSIAKGERVFLIEKDIPKVLNKKSCCLSCESWGEASVPVALDDLDSSKLIEKVCANKEKAN